MLETDLLIVSNKFRHFATRNNVATLSELENLLDSEKIFFPESRKIRLIPGQGFSERCIQEILTWSLSMRNAMYFDFSMLQNVPKRASPKLTHKHKIENILVSEPRQQHEHHFIADVLIDENCEMMQDHQTGFHIQGLLVVEAARQAYLATIEKFYLDKHDEKKYFIFNELKIDYKKFLFPMAAVVYLYNEKADFSTTKKHHTVTKIDIVQCGEISASLHMDVTIMPETRISSIECHFADISLDHHINEYAEIQHA